MREENKMMAKYLLNRLSWVLFFPFMCLVHAKELDDEHHDLSMFNLVSAVMIGVYSIPLFLIFSNDPRMLILAPSSVALISMPLNFILFSSLLHLQSKHEEFKEIALKRDAQKGDISLSDD